MKFTLEKKFRLDWIAALRSGQYQQTAGDLCTETLDGICYCGLGVAARVVGVPPSALIDHAKPAAVLAAIPEAARYRKLLENDKLVQSVSYLNDQEHRTFPRIAEWLELNTEGV